MKKIDHMLVLSQENGFGSIQLHMLPWLVKGAAVLALAEKSVTSMI
jgi:hypothetical protein